MQLKLRRSQKTGGMVTTNVIFCLDARIEFTPDEAQNISRYRLQNTVIYNSEASRRLLDKSAAQQDGSTMGSLKALATLAMVGLKLNISISSLQRGQHVECKTLEELLGAEQAIMDACENLKAYLAKAATFDGREVLIDFNSDQPTVVAHAATPQLIAPAPAPPAVPQLTSDYPPHEWERAPEPSAAEYVAANDTFGLPIDWNDEPTRIAIIFGGIIIFAVLLKSCGVV
jgi:hypothetical protein